MFTIIKKLFITVGTVGKDSVDKSCGNTESKTPQKSQTSSVPPPGTPQPSTSTCITNNTFKRFTLRTVPMEFSEGK